MALTAGGQRGLADSDGDVGRGQGIVWFGAPLSTAADVAFRAHATPLGVGLASGEVSSSSHAVQCSHRANIARAATSGSRGGPSHLRGNSPGLPITLHAYIIYRIRQPGTIRGLRRSATGDLMSAACWPYYGSSN